MVDAEKNPALGEIHQQRDQIVAPLQELRVLALMEVVNSNMDFRTAGHPARQLLAQEEIRLAPQLLGALDRVVVG